MKPALRTPLLTLHLWIGISVGVVFLVVALSGAVLVFRSKLERTLDPRRFIIEPGVARLAPDELVARARAAHPTAEFLSVRYYGDPTMPFLAYFSNKDYVHLNPYTGEVLGTRQRYGEGFGWVESVHKYLMLEPGVGENVNGSFAFVFIALLLSGVVLWWPATRRALKAGLTLNRKLAGRPWNLNVHKTVGIYVACVLLFSATSGVPISFESTRVVLDFVTGSKREAPLPVPAAPAGGFAGFNAVAERIASLMPDARETYIPLPKKGLVAAYAIAANAPQPNARSYVFFDPSATVLRFAPYEQASAGYRLYYWLLSLHTGTAGGFAVQLLLLTATLAVPVLAWTGVASYLRRKSRARVAVETRGLNPEPVPTK